MLFYHMLWTLVGGPLLLASQLYENSRLRTRLALDLSPCMDMKKSLWIHALSVGEVKSAVPLAQRIREKYPQKKLVFSTTTSQGLNLARKELSKVVHEIVPMPLDFWWSSERVICHIRPEIFVLVETDLWPGLLERLWRRNIDVLLVNGRISDKTFRHYKRFKVLARHLFKHIGLCLMQTERDRERLLELGIGPTRVITTGNIKFDRPAAVMNKEEKKEWHSKLGISSHSKIWVAGSTHGEESYMVLETFFALQRQCPDLILILAPRKIEQAPELYSFAREKGVRCLLRSQSEERYPAPPEIVILDTIGELERIYALGHIAFVGGSLVDLGGHNLLEPASFGCPVLYGPYTSNFAWMSDVLEEEGGGIRVSSPEKLKDCLKRILDDEALRKRMGSAALSFVKKNEGALAAVMAHIDDFIAKGGKAED
ncbi:MAG TPA: 3-deoxy-D-manno-octulosonic acid transferase [Desulfobacterales bacterium]|nr:3-deoxy-D-manno-octulosonic acid transferase [Desulfobacterales bacterium]